MCGKDSTNLEARQSPNMGILPRPKSKFRGEGQACRQRYFCLASLLVGMPLARTRALPIIACFLPPLLPQPAQPADILRFVLPPYLHIASIASTTLSPKLYGGEWKCVEESVEAPHRSYPLISIPLALPVEAMEAKCKA